MSRDDAVSRVRPTPVSDDSVEAKLIDGSELHTLTPNATLYNGQFDASSIYWAVEIKSPDGSQTIQATMDDDKTAWAIYSFPARPRAKGGGEEVQAGPGSNSAAFDALPDHAGECAS